MNQVAIHIEAVLLQVISNVLHQVWMIIQHIDLVPIMHEMRLLLCDSDDGLKHVPIV